MRRTTKCARHFIQAICMIGLLIGANIGALEAAELRAGIWSGGTAIGFLGSTPDGTAFATNLHADLHRSDPSFLNPIGAGLDLP